jgi:hypothetical protein
MKGILYFEPAVHAGISFTYARRNFITEEKQEVVEPIFSRRLATNVRPFPLEYVSRERSSLACCRLTSV